MPKARGRLSVLKGRRQVTVACARALRFNQTCGEGELWKELRNGQLEGVRFRRQHPVGRFVLDFFAPSHRLAIEIDGPTHNLDREHDAVRQQELEAAGIYFLRFKADEVDQNPKRCCQRIRETIRALPARFVRPGESFDR